MYFPAFQTHPYVMIQLNTVSSHFRFCDYVVTLIFIMDIVVYLSTGSKIEEGESWRRLYILIHTCSAAYRQSLYLSFFISRCFISPIGSFKSRIPLVTTHLSWLSLIIIVSWKTHTTGLNLPHELPQRTIFC